MRMKKFLPLILLGCYFSRTARAQEVWDLKKCVEYAVANNISVKQQDVQARLVGLVYKQYILSQIPTLSFQGNLSYNSGYTQNPQNFKLSTNSLYYNSYNLQSGINIFNFNNLRNNIAGSKLAFEAANATTDNIKNSVSLNVANAYLNFLLTNQLASTAQLQLKFSKASLEITRKLVNAGSVPELNAAELESQVAQDSSAYVTASSNVQTAILTVKAYMSFDAAAGFVLDTPPVDKIPIDSIADLQPADVYALALLNQPLQKADALVIKSQEKYVAASRAAFLPTVSLFGSLGSTYTNQTQEVTGFYTIPPPSSPVGTVKVGANSYDVFSTIPGTGVNFTSQPYFSQLNTAFRQSVGVSLSVPILNGGFAKVGYERAKLNLKNDQLLQQADNLALKQNIFQAYNLAVSALQKFESNKKTVDATQRSFDYAQKRYNIGLLNTIDLLTNQNNYFKAKNDLLYSQFDYVFKMKVLEFYKGMGIRL
jgi:outer membrane protein